MHIRFSVSLIGILLLSLAIVRPTAADGSRQVVGDAIAHARRPVSSGPVRLPPVTPIAPQAATSIEPFAVAPIADFGLIDAAMPPAVSLGLGLPAGEKPTIGGFSSFGYPGRGIAP